MPACPGVDAAATDAACDFRPRAECGTRSDTSRGGAQLRTQRHRPRPRVGAHRIGRRCAALPLLRRARVIVAQHATVRRGLACVGFRVGQPDIGVRVRILVMAIVECRCQDVKRRAKMLVIVRCKEDSAAVQVIGDSSLEHPKRASEICLTSRHVIRAMLDDFGIADIKVAGEHGLPGRRLRSYRARITRGRPVSRPGGRSPTRRSACRSPRSTRAV